MEDGDPAHDPVHSDFLADPEAFAAASARARHRHLRSLTVESAARELEALFAMAEEISRARARLGLPTARPLPPPHKAWIELPEEDPP